MATLRHCQHGLFPRRLFLVFILTACWASTSSSARIATQAGQLDPSFGTGGLVTTTFPPAGSTAFATAIQPDGKIIAAGWTAESSDPSSLRDIAIARYNQDGSPDSTFGINGRVVTDIAGRDDEAAAVAVTAEGKIIVAGQSFGLPSQSLPSGDSYFVVARYTAGGDLDPGFGAGGLEITNPATLMVGGLHARFASMVLQPDGRIVAAGWVGIQRQLVCPPLFLYLDYDFAILRFEKDGSLDHGFGTGGMASRDHAGGFDQASDVALDAEGRIVVSGSVAGGPGVCTGPLPQYFAVARFKSDGTPDSTFGTGGAAIHGLEGEASTVAVQADGKVVAAGGEHIQFQAVLARYDSGGDPDPTFGPAGIRTVPEISGSIRQILLQRDGKIVGVGEGADAPGDHHFGVVRYDGSGVPDPAFGSGGHVITPFPGAHDSEPHALARQPDGRIVVAGASDFRFALARYLGDGSGNIIFNGSFTPDASGWLFFATPNPSFIVANVVNGVLEFYRVPPPPGTTNQAVAFQLTGIPVPADAFVSAEFKLGNSSTVRKRISVLVHDSDFSDLTVCTFWLAPQAPLRTYRMRTMTTEAWGNATISFYAATAGSDGGAYLVDDVFVEYVPDSSSGATECLDPTAPAPVGGLPGPTLIVNGDFSGGLAPWSTFGTLTHQVAAGVFEFVRPSSTPPAGVVLQATGQSVAANEILTATFELGNSSAVRKRATVLLHDLNFSDLSACTFWLEPGQSLMPYVMRTFTTQPWTNATVSVYAATVGPESWTRLDDVTFQRTPAIALTGTECIGPASGLRPPRV